MRPGLVSWLVGAAAVGALVGGCGGGSPSNAAPATTTVLVALPLQVDASGLAAYADEAADSSDPEYRHFLTIAEIAQKYGTPAATIADDEKVLATDDLTLTIDPTHAAFAGTVTAAQAQHFFGATLVTGSGTIEPSGTPHAPAGLKGVAGVVGLRGSTSLPAQISGGTTNPACPPNPPSRPSIAKLYGFDTLTSGGATGSGTSIDILSIQRFEPAVFENFDRCMRSSLSASSVSASIVPNTPAASGGAEIALDSLALTLLAPRAHLHVVQFDPSTPLAFALMNILAAGPAPDALDITVTYCETGVKPAERTLAEWLLAAIAASGTTTVAAAGDDGSSGCYPNPAPAVTYPASSRFVTSVGGASYHGSAANPQKLSV
jgi:kumamolisin